MIDVAGLIVVMGMLGVLASRTVGPIKASPDGKELLVVQASFVDRLLMNRFQLMSLVVVLILGSGFFGPRWISHPLFLVAIVAAFTLVAVRFRYVFSEKGFTTHASAIRDWSDFSTYRFEGRRVVLVGDSAVRRVTLYAPPAAQHDLERIFRRCGLKRSQPTIVNRAASKGAR